MAEREHVCDGSIHGFSYVIWRGVVSGRFLAAITPPSGLRTVIGFQTGDGIHQAMTGVEAEIGKMRAGLPSHG